MGKERRNKEWQKEVRMKKNEIKMSNLQHYDANSFLVNHSKYMYTHVGHGMLTARRSIIVKRPTNLDRNTITTRWRALT